LPIFTQRGIYKGLPILDEFAGEKKNHYRDLLRKCVSYINSNSILECLMPDSAFYLFVNISKVGLDDSEFCLGLLDRHAVAITPGSSFGYEDHVRISVTGPDDQVMDGVKKIASFANEISK